MQIKQRVIKTNFLKYFANLVRVISAQQWRRDKVFVVLMKEVKNHRIYVRELQLLRREREINFLIFKNEYFELFTKVQSYTWLKEISYIYFSAT